MKVSIPENLQGKELFEFLKANKAALIAEKKYNVKHADAFSLSHFYIDQEGQITKAAPVSGESDTITVTSAINTTNWIDSHKDVHIPGLWKKSLSETKLLYLLQEHQMTFKGIITDEVQATTKRMSWKSLGVNAPGDTEVLLFNSTIQKSRNEYMFNEYRQGRVKNHSVGMRYVNLEMAINDQDYADEYAVWNKYIDQIANKSDAEESGYFWAVKEAKVIEGSAVPIGSNIITPTLEVKADTENEPQHSTQKQPSEAPQFDIKQLLTIF